MTSASEERSIIAAISTAKADIRHYISIVVAIRLAAVLGTFLPAAFGFKDVRVALNIIVCCYVMELPVAWAESATTAFASIAYDDTALGSLKRIGLAWGLTAWSAVTKLIFYGFLGWSAYDLLMPHP